MNIGYLRGILYGIEEIKAVGKSVKVDGVSCNVMGIVRDGMEIRLLILQYDESFQLRIEESKATALLDTSSRPETNRMIFHNDIKINAKNPFDSVLKVFIDDREFKVDSSEHRRLNAQDWEDILIIAQFLNYGWQPDEMDYQNIDMLFLTSLVLDGDYMSIPVSNQNPELRFVMGPCHEVHQVEKPITLVVGEDYPDRLMFWDVTTGVEHWVQINRVYLLDMWEEADKIFSNPNFQEQMTSEEITQIRLDFERKLLEVCPKGMCFPVIEYECEDELSLKFYTRSFLDAKPLSRSSGMGFIIRPDQPTGALGLRLKAALIQEPFPTNTNTIEVELFQYIHTTTRDDILLKLVLLKAKLIVVITLMAQMQSKKVNNMIYKK